jgi:hypothetical protein
MNGRFVFGALVALVVAGGAAVLGAAAYQAGIALGVAQSAAGTTSVVYYGLGHGAGFGLGWLVFGFFGFLFLLFLFGAIVRAMSFRHAGYGRWGGPGAWGGPDRWSGGHDGSQTASHERWRGTPWEAHAREIHDEWHRGSTPPADPTAAPPAAPDR